MSLRCSAQLAKHAIALAVVLASCRPAGSSAPPWRPPVLSLPGPDDAAPFWLSQTGLYEDIDAKRLAPDLLEFTPAHALWSDGADKRRWLRLPAGTRIDTTDMDHWRFPTGTMLFKEFSRGGRRIETRLIVRTPETADADADAGSWMGAFVWNDDESDARFVPEGQLDVRGTTHDVPTVTSCFTCHRGEPGGVLGYSAVQQPNAPRELLDEPPEVPYAPPGDPVTAAALGYLHANCGHCHNPDGSARPDSDMDLRLSVRDRTPDATGAYRTAVGHPLQRFQAPGVRMRVAPGDPEHSGVLYRLGRRDAVASMPPLGSEVVDEAGAARVREWIESLGPSETSEVTRGASLVVPSNSGR